MGNIEEHICMMTDELFLSNISLDELIFALWNIIKYSFDKHGTVVISCCKVKYNSITNSTDNNITNAIDNIDTIFDNRKFCLQKLLWETTKVLSAWIESNSDNSDLTKANVLIESLDYIYNVNALANLLHFIYVRFDMWIE